MSGLWNFKNGKIIEFLTKHVGNFIRNDKGLKVDIKFHIS